MAPLISRVIPSKNPYPFPIDAGPAVPPQEMYLRPERFAQLPAYTLAALAAFLIRPHLQGHELRIAAAVKWYELERIAASTPK